MKLRRKEGAVFYQWTSGRYVLTPECSPTECSMHGRFDPPKRVFWAWDRSLGAWVHYAAYAG